MRTYAQEMQTLDQLYDYLAVKHGERVAHDTTLAMAKYDIPCPDALQEALAAADRRDEHETQMMARRGY